MRRWHLWFVFFGLFGVAGEVLIGATFSLFFYELYIYYNGFWTSIESFLLFGLFGCIGLKGVLTRYELVRRPVVFGALATCEICGGILPDHDQEIHDELKRRLGKDDKTL